jgi:hypothetical protein
VCGECTGTFLYARYSLLLISNKFCNGRSRAVHYCTAPPHPSSAEGAESEGLNHGGSRRRGRCGGGNSSPPLPPLQ